MKNIPTKKQLSYAILTIPEFPQVKRRKADIAFWLREKAKEIEEADPKKYAKTVRFRLLKP